MANQYFFFFYSFFVGRLYDLFFELMIDCHRKFCFVLTNLTFILVLKSVV